MNRQRVMAIVACAVAGLLGAATYHMAFRCEAHSYLGFQATVCKKWFRPTFVTLAARDGRVFYYAVLSSGHVTHDPPETEFIDLFGSDRISEFVSTANRGRDGFVTRQEISTQDNGEVDIILDFEGRALKDAFAIDADRCSTWAQDRVAVLDRSVQRKMCTDASAIRRITRDEAARRIMDIHVLADRKVFLVDRFRASEGRSPGGDRVM